MKKNYKRAERSSIIRYHELKIPPKLGIVERRRHVDLTAAAASANGLPGIHAARASRHTAPNAGHALLTIPMVQQGVVQRNGDHQVDVKVVEEGVAWQYKILNSAAVLRALRRKACSVVLLRGATPPQ